MYAVKEAVFPFNKFPNSDLLLGPEMKSTGEVMGFDKDFVMAFAKSQIGADNSLPKQGLAFVSLKDSHKNEGIDLAKELIKFNLKDKSKGMYAVKEAVFPFNKFPNSDLLLGPEMKSTG